MGTWLNLAELLALVVWLGTLVSYTFLLPVAGGALGRMHLAGGIACAVLAGVQLSRGFLWYWGGMIRPSLAMFVVLSGVHFAAWALGWTRVHGLALALGVAYLLWMANRGY